MARVLKIMENEKHTLYDVKYGKKNNEKREKWEKHTVGPILWRENGNMWKMRHKHCLTWNMARNTEKGYKLWIDLQAKSKTSKDIRKIKQINIKKLTIKILISIFQ